MNTPAIQRDARDPQLLANLHSLGPVRVDHHMQTVQTVSTVQHTTRFTVVLYHVCLFFAQVKQARFKELFQSRARSEEEAASMRTPRNRLLVSSLVALLEERQNLFSRMSGGGEATTRDDDALRQLAEKYGMDVERLESLARSVNVPRVQEGGVRYVKDAQSGEETAISEVGSSSLFFSSRHGWGLMLRPGRMEVIGSLSRYRCSHTLSSS